MIRIVYRYGQTAPRPVAGDVITLPIGEGGGWSTRAYKERRGDPIQTLQKKLQKKDPQVITYEPKQKVLTKEKGSQGRPEIAQRVPKKPLT